MARIQGGRRNKLERSVHNWLCGSHIPHECWPRGFRTAGGTPDAVVHGPDRTMPLMLIFVDGCFWHGCPEHYRPPKGPRAEYWARHIADNVERDKRRKLIPYPWLAVWEHDVKSGAYKAAVKAAIWSFTRPRSKENAPP